MSIQPRSPPRPARGSPAASRAARKASASRTLPRLAITLSRELRRALGDQRFRFANEGPALHRAGEDDLAAAAEGVGDGARVGDREAAPAAFAVDDAEGDPAALLLDRAGHDLAGHLIARARRG